MDPDACRNCGHSGKHTTFLDHRCAIHERDDAERDKMQADAALERAHELCEASMALMKRQMQELEDANAAIETLSRALAAAEDRRERVRRDLGVHGDVCLTARSNLEAAEEMAIAAAGRYFEAGRAVSALEEGEEMRRSEEERQASYQQEDEADEEGEEREDARRYQRSNERFCKWLRQSEAQRQIMKSSWTKLRVAERLASEGGADEEQIARQTRVQEWAAARRSDLPPEEEEEQEVTMVTEGAGSEPAPVVAVPPTPAATRSGAARKAAAARTRGRAAAAPPASPAKTTVTTTGRTRRVESQTRSEPVRPTATRVKREAVAAPKATTTTRTTRAAKTGKTAKAGTGAAEAAALAATNASASLSTSGRPQRVTRRRSRVQPYPPPATQPRWK